MSLWTFIPLILATPLGLAALIVAFVVCRSRLADDDDEIGSGLIFDDEDFQPGALLVITRKRTLIAYGRMLGGFRFRNDRFDEVVEPNDHSKVETKLVD